MKFKVIKLSIVFFFLCSVISIFPSKSFAAANLALNKPTTTSSVWTQEYVGSMAVDGNKTGTSWISAWAEPASWIYVDLGSVQAVNQVKIFWPQYTYATAFKIQTSNDATVWTDQYSTTGSVGGVTDAAIPSVNARYVRVNMTAKADTYYEIFELEVYGSACTANCRTNNSAFLNADWFNGNIVLTDQQIIDYVNTLKQYKIKYQFADIGVLVNSADSTNGSLPAAGYSQLARWIKLSRLTDPSQLIIPALNYGARYSWVAGVKTPNPNFGTTTFNANLNAAANNLVNTGLQLAGITYKADGIHLDFEGFLSNDTTLLSTLQYVRNNALAANTNFSMSSPADYGSAHVWGDSFIAQTGAILNQINPMIYDSMGWGSLVVDSASYQDLWKTEVKRYSSALTGTTCLLMPTMPAYDKRTASDGVVYHDPAIENIYNAAKGLQAALLDPNSAHVYGSGIFWWSFFAGYYPAVYNRYTVDQNDWLTQWVNHN